MSMAQRVRKAVLPVAGLGTRFLPATKAMPKEMLTVVDRPLIQYAVEECLAAGIEEFVFVTGRNKSALEDHFDSAYELEATLQQRGKARELKQTQEATIKAGNGVFGHLGRHETGAGGEIKLTDAMARMIGRTPFHALRYSGRRYDCGSRIGFLEANVAVALHRADTTAETRALLERLLKG